MRTMKEGSSPSAAAQRSHTESTGPSTLPRCGACPYLTKGLTELLWERRARRSRGWLLSDHPLCFLGEFGGSFRHDPKHFGRRSPLDQCPSGFRVERHVEGRGGSHRCDARGVSALDGGGAATPPTTVSSRAPSSGATRFRSQGSVRSRPRKRSARTGRNPRTGEEIQIGPSTRPPSRRGKTSRIPFPDSFAMRSMEEPCSRVRLFSNRGSVRLGRLV
jgi:hypothetical protein